MAATIRRESKTMGLIETLRSALAGRYVTPPQPPSAIFKEFVPENEPEEFIEPASIAPRLENIEGVACAISYTDSGGRVSERTITCKRLDRKGGTAYLYAWCHVREQVRQFRTDRIREVYDIESGEVIAPHHFFARFSGSDGASPTNLWGLSVAHRADLLAGLNILTFIARCDRDFHADELEAVANYVDDWAEAHRYSDRLPVDDVSDHVARLAPDSEQFVVSLERVVDRGGTNLALIGDYMDAVIAADGVLHPNEAHWAYVARRVISEAG